MSIEENKAIIYRVTDEAWVKGNMAAIDEFCSAELTHNMSGYAPGREGVKQMVTMTRTALPDVRAILDDVIAEGDKVVARWTMSGTHQGSMHGVPPTGNRVTVPGITIFRFANGKIVERWDHWDTLGLMQQLGVIPTPG